MSLIALGIISAIIFIKFKPIYQVSISGEEVGYIESKTELEDNVKQTINENNENVDSVKITIEPEYELKLVNRTIETNEEEVASAITKDMIVTYKYYEIALNESVIDTVSTIEDAEELINEIKENKQEELEQNNINLTVTEKYTEEKVETSTIEIARVNLNSKVDTAIEEEKARKEEEERIKNMPDVNGIKLATAPITGTITSRYGVSSSIRSSRHTGLDIAATKGTPIKVVADGTVTFARYNGSYGYLVKVNHGNGVETWYAHTSKMYVTVGQEVKAGDIIALVGSTGNSTGPHLHFEIRINGEHVNPQNYLYK